MSPRADRRGGSFVWIALLLHGLFPEGRFLCEGLAEVLKVGLQVLVTELLQAGREVQDFQEDLQAGSRVQLRLCTGRFRQQQQEAYYGFEFLVFTTFLYFLLILL